jgi:hypothetical protein
MKLAGGGVKLKIKNAKLDMRNGDQLAERETRPVKPSPTKSNRKLRR